MVVESLSGDGVLAMALLALVLPVVCSWRLPAGGSQKHRLRLSPSALGSGPLRTNFALTLRDEKE